MKKNLLSAVLCGGLLVLTGCAPTVAEIVEMHNKDFVAGKFDTSMPYMQKLVKDDADGSHEDTPMWRLMISNAKMLTGDARAIEEFDAAEDIILKNDKTVKNYGKSMLVNDKYLTFDPGFQDRMFFSLAKALMYAEKGNFDAGRTELNRMMQYQEFWLKKRRAEIRASEKAMLESLKPEEKSDLPQSVNNQKNHLKQRVGRVYNNLINSNHVLGLIAKNAGFDLRKNPDISQLKPGDYQNAYATHFCGVVRMLNKDNGTAYLKDAIALKAKSRVIKNDYELALSNKVPRNKVWVYVEDGLCPVRLETRIDLPVFLVPFAGNYVKFMSLALPKLVWRRAASNYYIVAGKKMEELENIDRLLKTEYNIYMADAVKRDLLRCLLKTLPQVAAGILKDHTDDPRLRLAYSAVQYASAGYALASTRADLRTWNVLPKRVMVQCINKPADGKIVIQTDAQICQLLLPQHAACFDCKGSGKAENSTLNCIKCQGAGKFAASNYIVWIRKAARNSPFIHKIIAFPAK